MKKETYKIVKVKMENRFYTLTGVEYAELVRKGTKGIVVVYKA